MAEIIAKEHLERSGFIVIRKPALGGHYALGQAFTADRTASRSDAI
jgi:hypothetical protein